MKKCWMGPITTVLFLFRGSENRGGMSEHTLTHVHTELRSHCQAPAQRFMSVYTESPCHAITVALSHTHVVSVKNTSSCSTNLLSSRFISDVFTFSGA